MAVHRSTSSVEPADGTARHRSAAAGMADTSSLAGAALVLALAQDHRTDSAALLLVCLAATALGAGLARRAARGASLAWLGLPVGAVSAWLVPQRPDPGSAVVLAVAFGVGAGFVTPVERERPSAPARTVALAVLVVLAALDSRTALLVAGTSIVVFGAVVGYMGASTPSAGWFGGGVRHGDRHGGEVAITFDDGPNVYATPKVAAILDRYHTKGTFFIVGEALDARPDLVRALYRDGHLVANHSYHHDQWRWLDPRYPELRRTQEAFRRRLGVCPAFFRPPHGQRTPFMRWVADDEGVRLVMWDVSAGDWATRDEHRVARRVLRSVRSGSIIDLHDGLDGKPSVDRSVVVRALPLILDGLRARGLRPVRLDQLIGGPAYRPCKALDPRTAARPAREALITVITAASGTPMPTSRD